MLVGLLQVVVHIADFKEHQQLLCCHQVFCLEITIEQDLFHFVCVSDLLYVGHRKCTLYFLQTDHLHLINIVGSISLWAI